MKTTAEPALFTRTDRDGVTVLRFSRATVLPGADLGLIGQLWDFFEAQRTRPSKVLVLETPAELMKPGSRGAVTWFLTHHLGPGKALEILLDPGLVTAEKARELRLVNEVVPAADLDRWALERAAKLAALPTTALVALKRSLVATARPLHEYLDEECRIFERFV